MVDPRPVGVNPGSSYRNAELVRLFLLRVGAVDAVDLETSVRHGVSVARARIGDPDGFR